MSGISDDDLMLSASADDRAGNGGGTVSAPPVRGGSAVKAIFNPANKKRLVFTGIAAVFMVVVLFTVTVGFVDDEPQTNASLSASRTETARIGGDYTSDSDSLIQQEERRKYNEEILPELQQTEPTAHPLLEVRHDDYKVAEVEVNPFVEETVSEPSNVSEAVGISGAEQPQTGNSQGGGAPANMRDLDSVILDLIAKEGDGRAPNLSTVAWSYAVEDEQGQGSQGAQGGAGFTQALSAPQDAAGTTANSCQSYLARAGGMLMATTDLALNSDVLGPVSVTVRSGKLRGAQLLGTFERAETWLRINLNRMVFQDKTVGISAIALDTETTLNAVEGEVDRHVLYRYGWWGVGTALKAIGKGAEMNADTETIVSDGTVIQDTTSDSSREAKIMLGQLGQDMGDVFQSRLDRPITVSLNVGDEVGVFFIDDVCSETKSL